MKNARHSLFPGKTRKELQRLSVVSYAAALDEEAYLCLGIAHCFEKNSEGKLRDIMLIEPISASSLECMANGARTSFKSAVGVKFAEAMQRTRDALPAEFQSGVFCEGFLIRCEAAARTWLRPHAQDNLMDIVPLGKVRSQWNFSLDDKRVLNMDAVVNDDDNIKQDISIDVYGRKKKSEAAEAAVAQQAKEEAAKQTAAQQQDEELDALLSA
eukprot:CAMPEP_0202890766 /NCGR_PEP_ID=MMETSP1392-20130828/1072_1 /ASSEMBLY_ACC=CAM_ASM_000868 /TAXON_ID=225041 /ORGANISM="Chlamydomonas chlamydogama, Strain SAG 11-48b" /LENGTH=212 /DNA_ID=CAMNT_0049574401 /DNA_START=192 /DNA_END=830 /DNA_ORIENTATION=-